MRGREEDNGEKLGHGKDRAASFREEKRRREIGTGAKRFE